MFYSGCQLVGRIALGPVKNDRVVIQQVQSFVQDHAKLMALVIPVAVRVDQDALVGFDR